MPDHIRYDLLTQQALRSVVRNVLVDAAKKGLPGEHHFYISFDTRSDGVRLSDRLRGQYPEQMTIILQHQFWDLEVDDTGFSVGLSFGGVPEKLYVPFDAIKGFFDPSVQFGLQFEEMSETEGQPAGDTARPAGEAAKPGGKKKPPAPAAGPATASPPPAPAPAAAVSEKPDDPDKPTGGAEVVRLDRFRKK
jgi:hypothetical protein